MNYLYWLRQDLRVGYNQCFSLLPNGVRSLDIVFPWPDDFSRWSEARQGFFVESLLDMNRSLKNWGQKIWILETPLDHWLKISANRYQGLTFSKSFNSQQIHQELTVLKHFPRKENQVLWADQGTLYSETELPFEFAQLPKTFSAFRRKIAKNKQKEWPPLVALKALPPPNRLELSDMESFVKNLLCL